MVWCLIVAFVLMLTACGAAVYTCRISDPPPTLTKCDEGEGCAAKLTVPCKGDDAAVVVRWPGPVKLVVSRDATDGTD